MNALTRTRVTVLAAAGVLAASLATAALSEGTIAGFTDTVSGRGLFSATLWNLEGSIDYSNETSEGATWADHDRVPAEIRMPQQPIRPGSPVYSSFSLRLGSNARQPATVTMSAGELRASSAPGAEQHFLTRAVHSTYGTCSDRAFSASSQYLLGGPDAAVSPTTQPGAQTFNLSIGTPTSEPGQPNTVCFEFGVANEIEANGASLDVRWTFEAEAQEPES